MLRPLASVIAIATFALLAPGMLRHSGHLTLAKTCLADGMKGGGTPAARAADPARRRLGPPIGWLGMLNGVFITKSTYRSEDDDRPGRAIGLPEIELAAAQKERRLSLTLYQ